MLEACIFHLGIQSFGKALQVLQLGKSLLHLAIFHLQVPKASPPSLDDALACCKCFARPVLSSTKVTMALWSGWDTMILNAQATNPNKNAFLYVSIVKIDLMSCKKPLEQSALNRFASNPHDLRPTLKVTGHCQQGSTEVEEGGDKLACLSRGILLKNPEERNNVCKEAFTLLQSEQQLLVAFLVRVGISESA